MKESMEKILNGYHDFREKYAADDNSIMKKLHYQGQQPEIMVIACSDSRVDPALILQCDPGDLFVVRNVANIVPPYEKDDSHHGVSAALEFGICYLNVKHLILLGHSQCGGIQALLNDTQLKQNDFISNWVSLVDSDLSEGTQPDDYAKIALTKSLSNCMTFPWIRQRIENDTLDINLWFFDIKAGQIYACNQQDNVYLPLD